MIDEIFEMVMKEARKRPGDNLKEIAISVVDDLTDKIIATFNRGLVEELKSFNKDA